MSLAKLKRLSKKDPFWTDNLKSIIEKILKIESNPIVFIFGSFLTDHFNGESDLDLAVIVPDTVLRKDFLNKLYQGGPVSKWPLDLLVFKKSDFERKSQIGGVCFDIREDGVELYPNWRLIL